MLLHGMITREGEERIIIDELTMKWDDYLLIIQIIKSIGEDFLLNKGVCDESTTKNAKEWIRAIKRVIKECRKAKERIVV